MPEDRTQPVPRGPDPAAPEPITDVPTGRHEVPIEALPVVDLPDGSIVYADSRSRPRRAGIYENMRRDSPGREAMIMENVETGEQVVVQGAEDQVQMDAKARAQFLADRLWPESGAPCATPIRSTSRASRPSTTASRAA